MKASILSKGLPIYVVSGGSGASGELLVRTVLAQFDAVDISLHVEPHISSLEQIDMLVERVQAQGGIIAHTLVNQQFRQYLLESTAAHQVWQIDLIGPLITHLAQALAKEPLGQPGLYRQLHAAYFTRIEAIEFAIADDDGKRVEELAQAEIVLVGVSRVGKTPLSMFLAMQGWRVANTPFVVEVPPPPELFTIDSYKIVGLMLKPVELITHRRTRLLHTGAPSGSYVDPGTIGEELRAARHFFSRHQIPTIDATNKPIETSAEEVVSLVTQRKQQATRGFRRGL